MSTYLWIDFLVIIIPLIVTFHPRFKFYRKWKALGPAIILPAIFFIIWDMGFTYLKIWGFNPYHLSGFTVINLPIEEILFFIAIPYACVFTYDVIKNELHIKTNPAFLKNSTLLLAAFLIIIAIFNMDKLYTSVTFFLTASFLFLHIYILKSNYLAHFYLSYIIIYLIPFIIVNGILTGSLIGEPVVWYNNTENLAIRIFTIPVEDFFYGMLLYLMNVTIYEKLMTQEYPEKNSVLRPNPL